MRLRDFSLFSTSAKEPWLPIVFYQDRPDGVTNDARNAISAATRCNRAVFVIARSCDQAAWEPVECIPLTKLETKAIQFVIETHPGPPKNNPTRNSKKFEMASIIRWMYLNELMHLRGWSHVTHMDCDVVAFSNLASALSARISADSTTLGRNGAISRWSARGLSSFSRFLHLMVRHCPAGVLQQKFYVDMTIIQVWQLATRLAASSADPLLATRTMINATFTTRGCSPEFERLVPDLVAKIRVAHWSDEVFRGMMVGQPTVGRPLNRSQQTAACGRGGHKRVWATKTHRFYSPKFKHKQTPVALFQSFRMGNLCTPLVQDICSGAMVPFHATHYQGRAKSWIWVGVAWLHNVSSCKCVQRSEAVYRPGESRWLEGNQRGGWPLEDAGGLGRLARPLLL